MERLDRTVYHEWHVALNTATEARPDGAEYQGWRYRAKEMADEVPRMARLFLREQQGQLPTLHQQCSFSEPVPIEDNRLTCCLGIPCRACSHLLALEQANLTPEQIAEIKAWTCAGHILLSCGQSFVDTSEGWVLTKGDQMYWANVYASLSQPYEEDSDA